MTLLEGRGLTLRRGGRLLGTGLGLAVEAGQCWAILGGNGAGKSTLLHTLAGLLPAAAGEVHVDGRPLGQWRRRELARRLGVLFQDDAEPFPATVLETALAGRHPYLGRWQWEGEEERSVARAALARVGLAGFEGRLVESLSGGERRRLAMALLLTQETPLMLLDEPSNHLDLRHQMELLPLFVPAPGERRAALMVLHDVNLAARFCGHALLLFGDGGYLAGRCGEVLTEETLGRLYGYPVVRCAGPRGALWAPA